MSKHNNKATAGLVFGIISMLSWVLLIDYSNLLQKTKIQLFYLFYLKILIVLLIVKQKKSNFS